MSILQLVELLEQMTEVKDVFDKFTITTTKIKPEIDEETNVTV